MICRITYLPQDVVSNNLFFLKQKVKTGKLRYFSSIFCSMEILNNYSPSTNGL